MIVTTRHLTFLFSDWLSVGFLASLSSDILVADVIVGESCDKNTALMFP